DDVLRLDTMLEHGVGDRGGDAGMPQIERQNERLGLAYILELMGERLQPLATARHEHQLVTVAGEDARELQADAGRRAGDESDGTEAGHAEQFLHKRRPAAQ